MVSPRGFGPIGYHCVALALPAKAATCRVRAPRVPAAFILAHYSEVGVLASIAVAALLLACAFFLYRRRRNLASLSDPNKLDASEHWQATFENSSVGIAVCDGTGHYIETNRTYAEMVGYSQEELRRMSFPDLTWEEDRSPNQALFETMWSGKVPQFHVEKRYRHKDGHLIWARLTVSKRPGTGGGPPVSIAIVEDISTAKVAEARLHEYEKAVEGLQEMILVIDRNYRYLIANQAYLNYRGIGREQVVGRTVPELVGEDLFENIIKDRLNEAFGGRIVKYETEVVIPMLGKREVLVNYFPIEEGGDISRIAAVLEDITERKRAERELQRSLEQLHALNARLESVREEERTNLSRELHDRLGQALTSIKIDLAAAKAAAVSPPVAAKINSVMNFVDETIRSVRRISTELRPGILDDLGLAAAVEWAAEDFQARTGIACEVLLPEPDISVDRERATAMFRVLQETLTNVARHAAATRVVIRLSGSERQFSLEVQDNGCGIPADQVSAAGSLGILGMRERAFRLGGDFQIHGEPGSGTKVSVTFATSVGSA